MTKITYIPGEIANAAIDEHGNRKPVTRTQHIFDDALNKSQSQVNQDRIEDIAAEVQRAQGAESTLDGKIGAEKTRAEGVESGLNNRLGTVEQLAEISIGGGDAQIATGADFTNPDATKRAKVTTVGAIVDGLNDGVYDVSKRNPTGGPNSDGKFTLDYILSNADTLIPTGWRHGGMTISFVDSSDNKYKYVQFRCMSDTFSTAESDWQGVDAEPVNESKNLIESGGIYAVKKELDDFLEENTHAEMVDVPVEWMEKWLNRLEEGTHKVVLTDWGGSPVVTDKYYTAKIDVEKGEVYHIKCSATNDRPFYVIADENDIAIDGGVKYSSSGYTVFEGDVTILQGAKSLYVGNYVIDVPNPIIQKRLPVINGSEKVEVGGKSLVESGAIFSAIHEQTDVINADLFNEDVPFSYLHTMLNADGTTGYAEADLRTTSFIPVSLGDKYKYGGVAGASAIWGYDSDKEPLVALLTSGDYHVNPAEVEISNSSVKYIRAYSIFRDVPNSYLRKSETTKDKVANLEHLAKTAVENVAVNDGIKITDNANNGLIIKSRLLNLIPNYTASGSASAGGSITCSVSDNVYTFNGTLGSGDGGGRTNDVFRGVGGRFTLPKGTYTISIGQTTEKDLYLFLMKLSTNEAIVEMRCNEKSSQTFTLSEDTVVFLGFNQTAGSGTEYDNYKIRPMLSEGDVAKPFTPNTALTLNLCNTNLFDITHFVQRQGYSNLSVTQTNKVTNINGYDDGGRFAAFYIPTIIGQRYTLYYDPFGMSGINTIYWKELDEQPTQAFLFDGNRVGVVPDKAILKGGFSYVATKSYFVVQFELSANAQVNEIKFEAGNLTEWEPHYETSVILPSKIVNPVIIDNIGSGITLGVPVTIEYIYDVNKRIEYKNRKLKDINWCPIGDSLTDKMVKCRTNYFDYIRKQTGIMVCDFGIGGTGFCGDDSTLDARFSKRLSSMPLYTPDVITVFSSGNDVANITQYGYQIGDVSDTFEDHTYCGCVNEFFDNLVSLMPLVPIGLIVSIPWINLMPNHQTTMSQMNEKLIQIAEMRGIPYLDLFHKSGMNPDNTTFRNYYYAPDVDTTLEADGIHPNSKGQSFFASKIRQFVESLVAKV